MKTKTKKTIPNNIMPDYHEIKLGDQVVTFTGWSMDDAVAHTVARNGKVLSLNLEGLLIDHTERRAPTTADLEDIDTRSAIRCLVKACKALLAMNEALEITPAVKAKLVTNPFAHRLFGNY